MSSRKRELGCPAIRIISPTSGRACVLLANSVCCSSRFSRLLWIPPFDLAVFRRREGRCQGSRWGRLAQPLTTPFPERSSSQVEWRVLPRALGCRVLERLPSPCFHSHSQGVLGLDSVHVGVRDVPVLQSTKRSQVVPAVPPRPATISQSPGLQRESLWGPAVRSLRVVKLG